MQLRISTAPHIRSGVTTQSVMRDVLIALLPCAAVGIYRFGLSAALMLAVCMLTSVVSEYLWFKISKRPMEVRDLSALVTGMILGLNMPPTAPWWLGVVGSAFAIIIVKQFFGGIGDNFLNPAMTARAVLLASWPVHMTSYLAPLNNPLGAANTDALTSATPLTLAVDLGEVTSATKAAPPSLMELFLGDIPGTIGEVCKVAILIGFLYLLLRKVITPLIPLVMLATVALFTWIFGGDPLYAILSGGVLFGAVFMATDYTTSPMTYKGQAVFAIGAGLIVAIIRNFGAYPEGVTYAILLMNIATPLIDKYMKPKLFGRPSKAKEVRSNA